MASDDRHDYDSVEVAKYFDEYGQREWNRLIATPVDEVSLYIHTHYLKKFIQPGSRVLEIGAGPGRFTHVLANLGANVLVADISLVQLDLNRQNARQYGFADAVEDWQQVDICDLGLFASDSFDSVVAYGGPLSYVLERRDRALQECLRVMKKRGTLLLSVMSLWGSAHSRLDGVLSIPVEINQKITTTGDISPQTFPGRGNYMHMFRAGELRAWLNNANLSIVAMSASNSLSLGWEDYLLQVRLDDVKWHELLRMELEACAEEGALTMGTHMIVVAEKNKT